MAYFETMLNELLITFAVAMAPVIELRGAIPMGIAAGLPPGAAAAAAIAGNLLPLPFILLLARRVFDWLRAAAPFGPNIRRLERRARPEGRLVRAFRLPGPGAAAATCLPRT